MPAVDRLFGFDEPTQFMTEALWQRLWQLVTGNGVYMESSSSLAVVPTSPPSMNVVVQPGAAWVGGAYAEVTTAKTLAIAAAPASGTRIDRVVLRRNNTTNTVELDVVQGIPSSSPAPPSLTRAGDIYEVSLARVVVPAGTTAIGASNIIDERPDPQLCGHVTPGAPRGYTSRLVGGIATITLANGDNNNVALPNATIVRITGPTAAFAITGLAGGEEGRVVILTNNTSSPMTIVHQSTGSAAANRIITPTGGDLTASKAVLLAYDATVQRWRVVAVSSDITISSRVTVSLPTTVSNYVEFIALPADTPVRLVVDVPALNISKAYHFVTLNSSFSGVWDVPPAAAMVATPASNDVVLEMVWDATNSAAALRLRRAAGTATANAFVTIETPSTITSRSASGSSTANNPVWPRAQQGWSLIARAVLTASASSVSFQGLSLASGVLRLIVRATNADASVYNHLEVRLNGETATNWTTRYQYFDATGTLYSGSSNAGQIGSIDPNGQIFCVVDIGWLSGRMNMLSHSVSGGRSWISWSTRPFTGPLNRIDVVGSTNFAAGSVFELYQLLER